MEQHAVPQDITGFKFKLVGDMTLKQFGELAAGAVMAYFFYASALHPLVKWPFVVIFMLIGVALAFIPIEERPLDLWIFNFIRAIYRPTVYVWKKDVSGGMLFDDRNITTKPPVEKPLVKTPLGEPDLELTPWPYPGVGWDKKEEEDQKKEEKVATLDVTSIEPEIIETASEPRESVTNQGGATTPVTPVEVDKEVVAPPLRPSPQTVTTPQASTPPSVQTAAQTPSSTSSPLSIEELQRLRDQKLSELEEAKRQLQETTKQTREEAFRVSVGANAVTIDQLAKIREEKSAQKDKDVADQVTAGEAQLNILISQSKTLMEQIEVVRNKIGAITGGDSTQLKQQLDQLLEQKNDLTTRIKGLQDQLASQRAAPLTNPAYQEPRVVATPTPGVKVMDRPREKQTTISLTEQPNVISGMVVDDRGAPIEGVIILIKDKSGNSIRALKTNRVGQFVVATPMENGVYYVEMEKQGFGFSVLEVTLSGQVLPPLEIPARREAVSG